MNAVGKCKNCPRTFDRKREWQEFCSAECRRAYHQYGKITKPKMEELFRKEARRLLSEYQRTVEDLRGQVNGLKEDLARLRAERSVHA